MSKRLGKDVIEVIYKCACMGLEVKLSVPGRRGPAHDVGSWISDIVAAKIGADHRKRSPKCGATTMDYVKIPMPPGGDYIGQAQSAPINATQAESERLYREAVGEPAPPKAAHVEACPTEGCRLARGHEGEHVFR